MRARPLRARAHVLGRPLLLKAENWKRSSRLHDDLGDEDLDGDLDAAGMGRQR